MLKSIFFNFYCNFIIWQKKKTLLSKKFDNYRNTPYLVPATNLKILFNL
jgi:hypothetical protein